MEQYGDLLYLSFYALFILALYFLPTIIANNRGHHQLVPIFVINFFAGWTLIGWVGSLAWAFSAVKCRKTANG